MNETARKALLDDNGLNITDYIFDGKGGMKHNFALSETRIPNMDWICGVSQDAMHTSLQGTVPLEAGLMQYVFIRSADEF
eukprot:4373103-Pleurochrysis_carterae.AAC.1